jgi:hypothetical protein
MSSKQQTETPAPTLLNIALTIPQINSILGILSELPAKQTYELINTMKTQSEFQIASLNAKTEV